MSFFFSPQTSPTYLPPPLSTMSNVKVDPQPRVNASQLSAHIGNSVLLVGQMLSRDDGRLVLTAAVSATARELRAWRWPGGAAFPFTLLFSPPCPHP